MRSMQTSSSIDLIAKAMSTARGKFTPIDKTEEANAKAYSYKFADLAMVYDSTVEHMSTEGVFHFQSFETDEEGTFIKTFLLHSSGQWISIPGMKIVQTKILYDKDDNPFPVDLSPQELGISTTYARRYSFLAAVGVMPRKEDKDGDVGDQGPRFDDAKTIRPPKSSGSRTEPPAPKQTPPAQTADEGTEIRSKFHAEAKAAGWGLGDIKQFLTKKYGDFRTNSLSVEALTEASAYFKAHKPGEITPENPITNSDLPENMQ